MRLRATLLLPFFAWAPVAHGEAPPAPAPAASPAEATNPQLQLVPPPAPPPEDTAPPLVPQAPGSRGESRLRYDLRIDLPITAVGAAAWVASELAKKYIAPAQCAWCDRASNGTDSLNGFDAWFRNHLRLSSPAAADTASGVLAFGVVPLLGLGIDALAAWHDGHPRNIGVDFLLIAEATIAASDITQVVKFTTGRERPFVHNLSPLDKSLTAAPADNNLSFFSSHTSFAFSLAVSAGTVASMRHYRLAPLIWATGLAAAATVGYLRIASDRHYATDVIAGAAIGSAVGFAIPYLFHRPRREYKGVNFSVGAMPSGAGLSVSGTF